MELTELAPAESASLPPDAQRLRRPSMSERQYSAHVYTLCSENLPEVEIDISEPERAYVSRREACHWPEESLVTVRERTGRSRAEEEEDKKSATASSGISIREMTPIEPLVERAIVRGEGVYRCSIKDLVRSHEASRNTDGPTTAESDTTVTYQLQQVDSEAAHIATQEFLNELAEAFPLPDANGPKWWNDLRYHFFSTYRRLFALVLLANLVATSVMIARVVEHPASFTHGDATTAVAANIFVGVFMRHEHCVNALFRISVSIPHFVPLSIRRRAAKVYNYGGVHSACGVSACLWYIFYAVLLISSLRHESDVYSKTLVALTSLVLVVFVVLIGMAYPTLRSRYHDQWEMSHRFGGWIGIALIWAQLVVIVMGTARRERRPFGRVLVSTPAFWFLCAITCLIIYPWLRLRRLRFDAERLSSHAIRLRFHDRRLDTSKAVKLSSSPLLENHGFASIPNPNGSMGYSVLVSRAGNWTEQLINHPPAHIWRRGAATTGVSRVAQLFRSTVIVATGSGIGPSLSWLQAHPSSPQTPCRVIWSARFPEATYGRDILQAVFTADPGAIVIDTKKTGRRPKLLEIVYALYGQCQAEAVIIISNPAVTQEVVFGLETRNIPAYGAIFDS